MLAEATELLLTFDIFPQSNGDLEDWQMMAIAGVASLAVSGGLAKVSYGYYRKSRAIKNRATEPIRSLAMGTTELKGRAKPYGEPYPQPFKEGECVTADYNIEERVTKEDDDGEQTTEWETVRSGTLGDHVVLEDETGAIVVDDPPISYRRSAKTQNTEGRLSHWFEGTFMERWFDLSPNEPTQRFLNEEVNLAVNSSNRRRYTQRALTEDTSLYALGEATHHDDSLDYEVLEELDERHDSFQEDYVLTSGEDYIVSDKDEATLIRRYYLLGVIWFTFGLAVFLFALYALMLTLIELGV